MSSQNHDTYSKSLHNFDGLNSQVNNVVAGKEPTQMNIMKWLKRPYIYGPAIFIVVLIILWFLDFGFLKDQETKKTKTWLLLLIAGVVALAASVGIFFFLRSRQPQLT